MSYCQGCACLSKKLEELEKYKCYVLSPTNNPSENVAEYVTRLEAKLEKAVEALRAVENYSDGCGCCSSQIVSMNEKVEAFFKEIKGA